MAKTILVVDDLSTIRELVAFALNEEGYGVISAVNGRDALHKLRKASIDVVITELDLPVMDGIELIKEIRSKPEYRFVPIITMASGSQDFKKDEIIIEGANAWILKPFTNDQLVQLINGIVEATFGR